MVVYAIVKYLGYSLWCYAGLRLLAEQTASPDGLAGRFCVGRCVC